MTAKESSSRSVATTLVLFAAAFLAILDLFIVNVAYSDIRLAFHDADLSAMSWMLNTYTIVVAAVLAPAGGSAIATVIGEYFWRGSACSWLDRCPVAYRRRSRSWWPPRS